jgi:hypothetical protein
MSRELESALASELQAPVLRPILGCEFLFDGGAIRLWAGLGNLALNGETFVGAGALIAISEYEETAALDAKGLTFTLSGIESSILSLALAEPYQGRICNLYLAAMDDAGVLVSPSYLLFSGLMDTMSIEEAGETCTVSVTAESRMVILTRAKERRYTNEDQKAQYPDDRGLEYVAGMADKQIVWKAGTK